MIDPNKCKYEESAKYDGQTVHYFTYPKDLTEQEFYPEEDYGEVVSMCISLTMQENGECRLQMSPTVEEDDALVDTDWRDLYEGLNYTPDMIAKLLAKTTM